MSTQESVKRSIANSALGSVGSNVVSLAGFVVLARMLAPSEFGMMAAVTVLVGLSRIVVDLGLSAALVQNNNITEKHYGAVFFVHLMVGLICAALMLMGSGAIENFFGMEGLSEISRVCAWLFLLNAISFVPLSRLEKMRQFRYVARVELYSTLLSTTLAIYLAWKGYGVWALVASFYSMSITMALLALYFSRWVPKIFIGKKELAELWVFSRYLVAMQALNYAAGNLDKILIGKYLGAQTLGAYRYGDRIAQLPTMLVNKIFGRVLFPAFSSYQNDKARIRYQYLKAIRLVSFVTFPVLLGLSMISDHVVMTILGDKWSEMVVILPLLALSLLLTTIGVLNLNIYKALGRTKRLFKISVLFRINLIVCMFVGIQYGLVGLLIGLIVARYVNFLPALYVAGRLIDVSLNDVSMNIYRALVSCGVMIGVLFMAENIFALLPGSFISMLILMALGVASYMLVSFVFQRQTLTDIVNIIGIRK